MIINGKEYNIEELTKQIKLDPLVQRSNNLILRDSHIEILNKYNINYLDFPSLSSLILEIEDILNTDPDLEDLEQLSQELQEINYYNYTNK